MLVFFYFKKTDPTAIREEEEITRSAQTTDPTPTLPPNTPPGDLFHGERGCGRSETIDVNGLQQGPGGRSPGEVFVRLPEGVEFPGRLYVMYTAGLGSVRVSPHYSCWIYLITCRACTLIPFVSPLLSSCHCYLLPMLPPAHYRHQVGRNALLWPTPYSCSMTFIVHSETFPILLYPCRLFYHRYCSLVF